jgi:hypothetical protein
MCSSNNPIVLEKKDFIKELSMNVSGSDDDWDNEESLSSVFSKALESLLLIEEQLNSVVQVGYIKSRSILHWLGSITEG